MARYNALLPSMMLTRREHPFTRDVKYDGKGGVDANTKGFVDSTVTDSTSSSSSTVIWINTFINITATQSSKAINKSNSDGVGSEPSSSSSLSSLSSCAIFKFRLSLPTTPLLTQPAASPEPPKTTIQPKPIAQHASQPPEAPEMVRGTPQQKRKRRLQQQQQQQQQPLCRSVRFEDTADECEDSRDDSDSDDESCSNVSLSSQLYITEDEVEATWYQKSDYQKFKQEYNETKKLLQMLLPLDQETQTSVGLEYYDTASIITAANAAAAATGNNEDAASQQQQVVTTLRQRKSQRRRFVIQTILAEQDIQRRISNMYDNHYECYGSITLYDIYYNDDETKSGEGDDDNSIAKLCEELTTESVQDALRIGLQLEDQVQQEEQQQGREMQDVGEGKDAFHDIDL